ncbi:MAG: helix-turn-helix transcriptional regulator [Clostridia bacterium]|nr:helix-turn-helix transcriptional regulator [Clostridia bacterium]
MSGKNYVQNFANNIKKLRVEKNLSQEVMAEKIGVSRTTLGAYEKGDTCPNIDVVAQIADVFGISLDELIGRIVDLSKGDMTR